jgi:hypothetical protein
MTTAPTGDAPLAPTEGPPDPVAACPSCDATPALTGLSRRQFHDLAATAEPLWRQRRLEALNRPGRLTRVGGGRKFSLPFGSRLFLAVLHLRWGVTYRALGALFDVGTQTVERACRDLRPVLATAPVRCVRVPNHRGSQLLLAELERAGISDRRALLEAVGGGCGRCATGPGVSSR